VISMKKFLLVFALAIAVYPQYNYVAQQLQMLRERELSVQRQAQQYTQQYNSKVEQLQQQIQYATQQYNSQIEQLQRDMSSLQQQEDMLLR
jgi:hypothetical protein